MYSCHTLRLLIGAGLLLVSYTALAGEWRRSASLPVTLEHDSNPQLVVTNKKSLSKAIATPSYNLTGTYGVDELKAELALRVERSSDETISLNREDPSLLLGWQHQMATGGFGLTAKYDEASTRYSELEETGLMVRDGKRKTRSAGGNWSHSVTERNSLAANIEYKDVVYDGGVLTDFTNASGGVAWTYIWGEQAEPFLQLSASHYNPENSAIATSNSSSLMAGMKLKLSEQLVCTAQAGANRVTGRTRNTGSQGSLMLHYSGFRNDVSLNISRSTNASGEGRFVESDQAGGAWSYALSEFTHAGMDASWRRSRGAVPNTMQLAGIWIKRDLSHFWNAHLYYQHKQRQQEGQPDAIANVVGVSITYNHPDF